jgi:hypothetical protein
MVTPDDGMITISQSIVLFVILHWGDLMKLMSLLRKLIVDTSKGPLHNKLTNIQNNSPANVHHFVAICPILVEHRRNWLGSSFLTTEQVLFFMQGFSYFKLAKYCEQAFVWRSRYI